MGPLAGLKVIDLTHVMAGPTCTLMLADMGADVIKVEKIPDGDDTRRDGAAVIEGEAAAFMMMNRNKRGIALDLKTAGGRRVLARLLADADVVVENYRPGTMAKLGFDYEALRQDQPRPDLLRALGLRPHRALRPSRRLRSGRPGDERHHEHHRRGPGPAAGRSAARRSPTSPAASSRRWASSPPTPIA